MLGGKGSERQSQKINLSLKISGGLWRGRGGGSGGGGQRLCPDGDNQWEALLHRQVRCHWPQATLPTRYSIFFYIILHSITKWRILFTAGSVANKFLVVNNYKKINNFTQFIPVFVCICHLFRKMDRGGVLQDWQFYSHFPLCSRT